MGGAVSLVSVLECGSCVSTVCIFLNLQYFLDFLMVSDHLRVHTSLLITSASLERSLGDVSPRTSLRAVGCKKNRNLAHY